MIAPDTQPNTDLEPRLRRALARLEGFARPHVALASLTTLRVGGVADLLVQPRNAAQLQRALETLHDLEIPVLPLGGGSNMLIGDRGFRGAVIRLGALRSVERRGHTLRVGAGTPLSLLVHRCSRLGLAGLEGLAGIPGTVGGAVFMNAGGRHAEIGDVVERITVLDPSGHPQQLEHAAIGFHYRGTALGDRIVSEVVLRLRPGDPERLQRRVHEILEAKRNSQPFGLRSAGCVFRNPGGRHPAAAWLIDRTGCKGLRYGGAAVSTRHANFIVNDDRARASDVLALIERVRNRVRERWDVALQLEVQVIGEHGREAA